MVQAVLLLDADFVPSPNMLAKYKTPKVHARCHVLVTPL
jgi:hypothetical protein